MIEVKIGYQVNHLRYCLTCWRIIKNKAVGFTIFESDKQYNPIMKCSNCGVSL